MGWPDNTRTELGVESWTIYVSALYWSYVTTSHVGVGDIVASNLYERVYSIFVILIGTFIFLNFFGNIVPIAERLVSKLKKQFQKNYQFASAHMRAINLD
mmetsp:Transcript_36745/g.32963  ORF Transcript_36745/g.32963 Transcript_36745/m.32963 type:complete len:100 (+) Transcript_36745:1334-1633(+)